MEDNKFFCVADLRVLKVENMEKLELPLRDLMVVKDFIYPSSPKDLREVISDKQQRQILQEEDNETERSMTVLEKQEKKKRRVEQYPHLDESDNDSQGYRQPVQFSSAQFFAPQFPPPRQFAPQYPPVPQPPPPPIMPPCIDWNQTGVCAFNPC
ncbi:hypothetical protein BV898_06040 [Hypsibius exemplaris]|uniref:Uncharacterized protein n=1 Tax=Hypsibius exemplaris TaxID=2072580 RepID=A0A1W0WXV8_HYPEX|nr:hypothetical protein BV898_06040 [Hypsibius exemplaris]